MTYTFDLPDNAGILVCTLDYDVLCIENSQYVTYEVQGGAKKYENIKFEIVEELIYTHEIIPVWRTEENEYSSVISNLLLTPIGVNYGASMAYGALKVFITISGVKYSFISQFTMPCRLREYGDSGGDLTIADDKLLDIIRCDENGNDAEFGRYMKIRYSERISSGFVTTDTSLLQGQRKIVVENFDQTSRIASIDNKLIHLTTYYTKDGQRTYMTFYIENKPKMITWDVFDPYEKYSISIISTDGEGDDYWESTEAYTVSYPNMIQGGWYFPNDTLRGVAFGAKSSSTEDNYKTEFYQIANINNGIFCCGQTNMTQNNLGIQHGQYHTNTNIVYIGYDIQIPIYFDKTYKTAPAVFICLAKDDGFSPNYLLSVHASEVTTRGFKAHIVNTSSNVQYNYNSFDVSWIAIGELNGDDYTYMPTAYAIAPE